MLLAALTCSTTAVVSGEPLMRNARTNACRRIAASRHCGSRCNHAPRPGSFLAVSTVTTHLPFPPSTATTRSSSTASSRFRQPTHVRTGPLGTSVADRASAAEVSRWITVQSSHTWSPGRNGRPHRSVVSRRRISPRVLPPHRCGCRCATPSAAPPGGRSAPPCRSRATAGNPARRHARPWRSRR